METRQALTFTEGAPKRHPNHTRRILVWAVAVSAIVAVLGAQHYFPHLGFLPRAETPFQAGATLMIFLVALVCEYVDSSLGMGYGTTLTPLLLLAGFEPLQIVPAVLMSECLSGLAACAMHQRDGNVDFRGDRPSRTTAILLSALSAVGALAAVALALKLPKLYLKLFIASIILSVGVVILATARRTLRFRAGHIVALGALAAFNKGLSGGGYGPLVTGGQIVSGLNPKHAIAITSLAEGLTCLVGFTAYVLTTGAPDWSLAAPLSLGALLSVPMATLTVRRFNESFIRACVGTLTLILGLLTFAKVLF